MQSFESNLSDDIRRYLGVLLHWLWLLIFLAIVAGGIGYIISIRTIPVYQSSATFLINEAPGTGANSYNSLLTSQRNQSTYVDMVTRDPVLQAVIKNLNLSNVISTQKLKSAISTQAVRDTVLVTVFVQDTNRERAALIANAIVNELSIYVKTLQTQRYATSKEGLLKQIADLDTQISDLSDQKKGLVSTDPEYARLESNLTTYRSAKTSLVQSLEQIRLTEAQSTATIIMVEEAKPSNNPIRPKTLTNILITILGGLVLAVVVIFAAEFFDDTLRDPSDVERITGLPVLGAISKFDTSQSELVAHISPRTPVAEAFRSIRTNIQFTSVDKNPRVILVTSPSPSDGKSTVAANLAVVISQSNKQVVLMDTDLRRPRVHKVLGLSNRHGLTELFVQPEIDFEGITQESGVNNLTILTSGGIPPNPSELLGTEKMETIIHAMLDKFDTVVIDSPPVLAVTDASVLVQKVDGVILVVKPGQTKLAAIRQSYEQLRRAGAKVLGVVLNGIELKRSRYYYYYQYRGYYYSYYSNYTENGDKRRDKKSSDQSDGIQSDQEVKVSRSSS